MNESDYLDALNIEFSFNKRFSPIPSDLRPIWKLVIITLILHKCCSKKTCSFQKMQVLCWAVKNKKNQHELLRFVSDKNTNVSFNLVVRYEPSVNRIIEISLAEGYVEQINGNRLRLTDKGESLAIEIEKSNDVFIEEKSFFKSVGKSLSEKLLSDLSKELRKNET